MMIFNISKEEREKLPPELQKKFKEFCSKGGKMCMSTAKRRAVSKMMAKRIWEKRRKRYGPRGWGKPTARRHHTKKQVMESVICKNPDMIDHPVWKES